ncbi:MAG TPA: hypothetical protein VKA46_00830 [Gemmataceae bacterium]|nr:hypothetical protein [Gemmataceae bacterium]
MSQAVPASQAGEDRAAVVGAAPQPAAATDPLARARKEASATLFVIAFLLLCSTVMVAVLPLLLGATTAWGAMALALGRTGGLTIIFAALGVWARFKPLPAAAVGLGLFIVLVVLAVLNILSAHERIGVGIVVQFLVQFVLGALLVNAIRISLKGARQPVIDPSALATGRSERADGEAVGRANGGAAGAL